MPVPTIIKTWIKNCNQTFGTTSASLTDSRALMLGIVNGLLGFVGGHCVCWGSCDGTGGAGSFGNGDAVNRWSGVTKLVWAVATSNHSWIVISLPHLAANAAICIDLCSANASNITLAYSDLGFGVANGGADGTATARPTASAASEQVLISLNSWGVPAAAFTAKLHQWCSSDGQCIRVAICYNNLASGIWMFETLKTPVTGWTFPVVLALGSSGNAGESTVTLLVNAANLKSRNTGTAAFVTAYMGCDGYRNLTAAAAQVGPNSFSTKWPMLDISVWSETASNIGRLGYLYDAWFGLTATNLGEDYPDETVPTPVQHVYWQVEDIIFPGDGTAMLTA